MKDLTLPQLLSWLNKAEETGHYRGYSRHELAMEYNRRISYMRLVEKRKNFLYYEK